MPKEELKTLKRMYYRLGTIKVRLYRVAVVCGLDNSSSMTKYAREHFRNASDARRVEGMVVPENAVKGQFASLHTTYSAMYFLLVITMLTAGKDSKMQRVMVIMKS